MAKITLITQWFPPEPAYLWKDLAISLKNNGHNVTVITGFPNYPYGKIYKGYKQSLTSIENFEGVKVVRLPIYPNHSTSIIKRGLSYISFAVSVAIIGIFKVGKPDLILCYSPPLTTVIAAAWIAKLKRVPFILNIQDMWPDTLISGGMIKEGLLTKVIGIVAKWLYKNARGIVVLSGGFKQHLEKLGVDPKKTHVISNWSLDYENNKPQQSSVSWRDKLGLTSNDYIVMFAGNIGPAQSLETVIEAAEKVSGNPFIKVVFVGDGIELLNLINMVKEKNLGNVFFAGRVPYEEMENLYQIADALLIHLKKDPLFEITIPHKLLAYLSLGKPIVSAVNGEVNRIVSSASAGLVCNSEDAEELSKLFLEVSKLSDDNKKKINKSAKDYFTANFSKQFLLGKWNDIVLQSLK